MIHVYVQRKDKNYGSLIRLTCIYKKKTFWYTKIKACDPLLCTNTSRCKIP